MHKFFNTISSKLVFIILASMLFGFAYGLIFPADFLHSLIVPCAFFVVYPMMVSLKIEEVFKGNDIKLQFFAQIINFCIVPFVAFGIGLVFFSDNPYMLLGMLLIGLLPAGGGTISWIGLAKGNIRSAIKMVMMGPIIGIILAPFYIKFLIGPSLDMDLLMVIRQIVFIILLPMLFGVLTRKIFLARNSGKDSKKSLLTIFPSFSIVGIIGIVFIAMALKAKNIVQDPSMFIYVLFPVALLYFVNFTLSTFVGRMFF